MARRYSQPQIAVEVDWNNPITRGLSFATSDLLAPTGGELVVVGAPYKVIGTGGEAAAFPNYESYFNVVGTQAIPNGSDYTLFAFASISSFSQFSHLLDADPSFPRVFQFRVDTPSGKLNFITFNTSGTSFSSISDIITTLNKDTSFIGRVSNSVATVFVDGIVSGTPTTVTGTCYGIPKDAVRVGSRPNAGVGGFRGHIYCVAYWARALSDEEIKSLSDNPWQIFKPVSKKLFPQQGAGPVDHVTHGTVRGPGADVLGTSTHEPSVQTHPSGGNPRGFSATVVGTAIRGRIHEADGFVTGFTTDVVGAAYRFRAHGSSGIVVPDYSTVSGAADQSSPTGEHDVEGYVVAGEGTVTGASTSFSKLTSSGVVVGTTSTVVGSAKNVKKHATSGNLIGRATNVVGTARRADALIDHGTFGDVEADYATVTGTAMFGTRTLTPADIDAIVEALRAAILPVNIVEVNFGPVDGSGADNDPWGPV